MNKQVSNLTRSRPGFARWLGETNDVTRMFLAAGQIPGLINLAGGLPEPSVYPVSALAKIAEQVTSNYPEDALNYSPIEGLPGLRDLLAARFSTDDLQLTRENVLITTGGMQGLDLIGKVLLDQDGLVACQSPAYLGALDAWRPRSPRYRPLFLERDNFHAVDGLSGAQFAYTVPNFSNPTGKLIDTATRQSLVEAADLTRTWLVEDDPYGTLYYDDKPLPRMLSLLGGLKPGPYTGPVIYLGTLSKELAPGLRVGWAIASPEMIEALTIAKQGSDMCTSGLTQCIATDALKMGLDRKILPNILDIYRTRRDALCTALEEYLSPWFEWEFPVGGMFVWIVAKNPALNTDLLLEEAMKAKVCISPSSVFDPEGQYRRAVRINFTRNSPTLLTEGIRRLGIAAEALSTR